jgi:Cu/Ag efflux protein CusF
MSDHRGRPATAETAPGDRALAPTSFTRLAVAVAASLLVPCAVAQGMAHPATSNTQAGAAQQAAVSHGEVRKIDKATGHVILKHGPIRNLGMGAMTMEFVARDPAALKDLKEGDKVDFVAEDVKGVLYLSKIEKTK